MSYLKISVRVTLFPDPAEKEGKVKESVERAKEAVALDVKDGTSWSKLFSDSDTLTINFVILGMNNLLVVVVTTFTYFPLSLLQWF